MRQTSEQFMNEMLKDNVNDTDFSGISDQEKMEKMIDEKLDGFWKKFQKEVSSIIPTAPVQEVETTEETDNANNDDNSVDNVDGTEGE
mgnify:CR=1 FL=1